MKKAYWLSIILFFYFFSLKGQPVIKNPDWNRFLSAHDLTFNKMPVSWEQAPFFGNGFIASMVYGDSTDLNRIMIQVFRTDVQDHRDSTAGWTAYSRPRLPIGHFELQTKGKITACNLRLSLWNAELTGTIQTTAGSLKLKHEVSAQKDLIFTDITTTGNENYTLTWHPDEAKSTRKILFPLSADIIPKFAAVYGEKYRSILKVYQPNPAPIYNRIRGVNVSTQNLLAGGQYTTAWKQEKLSAHQSLLTLTIQNSYPEQIATDQAVRLLTVNGRTNYAKNYQDHLQWWHTYYRKSFMTIPDKKLESFYWQQIYKLGCASRANGPVMDTSGPWFQPTPWPYITWDLNVQLCYWALNTSNHLDIAASLPNTLKRYQQHLINNVVPPEWRKDAAYLSITTAQDLIGSADDDIRYQHINANLPWVMHNVWLMYRYSMNKQFLKESCYPLLEKSMSYYLHLIKKEQDGKYHIPVGYSPEYPEKKSGQAGETKDANIDISLLKWGLQTLIASSKILNINADKRSNWSDILNNLADYPVDETGFRIGADLPFAVSHRHYSHLLMIYPLYLINADQPKNIPLIERSLSTWLSDPKALKGYSYTGAASISAAIGKGDDALKYIRGLYKFLLPNGLYKENGPCFETPLSAAQSLQDMLLQSWGDKIRIFPAVPHEWKNLYFDRWLAEGAFEVSAKLFNGETEFIVIKSLAGTRCTFTTTIKKPVAFIGRKKVELKMVAKNTYRVNLTRGQSVVIKKKGFNGPLFASTIN
ncbi:glycosyl hydrolase family 95 catalytic domain-containing protein [Mucilaginibacter arboris]|uniref:Alpha-L-fucosidase n=1 Tax=Mucilaginibacter arboris TaxID=2682090 RepID=A0A7K1STS8_9SPHI|nr:alpha-L-fucosidase [Mucilaginibacter arboris]MVN20721.1 alpha-L-fucosidase [Mucilaginibacter arboris]